MTRPITLIFLVACVGFRNISIAQDEVKIAEEKDSKRDTKSYNIQSLDGKNQKVRIMPDYPNHVLRISCLKDTINIYDYWDVPPATLVLNKNFIKLEYEVRGGSNLGLGNVIVLCVNGDKLYEAIHVLRYMNSETSFKIDSKTFKESSSYNIKMNLKGSDKSSYKLNVDIDDKVSSMHDPKTNYSYHNQTILSFDESSNVFYSVKENIYANFEIYDSKKDKPYKQSIKGNFHVAILGQETYYFIKGGWYSVGRNNELTGYTSR